jgi:uncharacterized protein (DUF927 family)
MANGDIDRAFRIAEALGGVSGPDANGNYKCCCPAHPDENPSLSVKDGDDGQLLVHCFSGCAGPAIFAELSRRGLWAPAASTDEGGDDDDAKDDGGGGDAAGGVEGGDEDAEEDGDEAEPAEDPAEAATRARAEAREKRLARERAKFQKGWAAFDAQSALHATVDAYCDWRGVTRFAAAPEWLRFTPAGRHVGKDKNGQRFEQFFPMLLVAGVNPVTGELLGGQREYLAYGGRGFAPVDKKERKKTAPGVSLKGAVARIAEPAEGEFLVVGEGWATVRTVMDATGLAGWSVFGASGLASFDPPDTVKEVLFLGENDADAHNAEALKKVCPRLNERGIKIGVARPPPGLNDFNDLVRMRDDGSRLHGTVEVGLKVVRDIVEKAKARAKSKDDGPATAAGAVPPGIDLPGLDDDEEGNKRFSMAPTGLYRGRMFVCGPFEAVAHTRVITDGKTGEWGLRLRFKDRDGASIEKAISSGDLVDPGALGRDLLEAGLHLRATPAARAALVEYLGDVEVKGRALVAKRTGWTTVNGAPVFVFPGQTIGASSESVVLASGGRAVAYAQAGTLSEWQEHIGKPAGQHLLLQFGISVIWATALLQMTGGESGGFHLWEFSSRGKTTIQQVAASLWGSGALNGGFIRRWRATANSLEATFASASDVGLVLDELSQLEYGQVAPVVYMLTGETGKGRLRADATARTPYSWRILALSSGETPIATRLNEDRYQRGGRSGELRGGASVRVIDIAADRTYGAFDRPAHDSGFNPAAFAEHMQEMASTYYGTAGPAFVKALIEEKISGEHVRRSVDDFVAGVLGDAQKNSEGQARRVARRFALPAAAGLMAIGAGIVEWDAKAFAEGVRGLFHNWANARGSGPVEETRIIAFARGLWAKYGKLRFERIGSDLGHEWVTSERWGFRRDEPDGEKWLMFPSVFDEQFAAVGARKAVEVLFRNNILEKGTEADRWTKRVQLPGMKQQSFYVINESIFEGADEPE